MFRNAPIKLLLSVVTTAIAWPAAADDNVDVSALRAETRQLEQQMYEIYNGLNSDDEFDVTCDEYKVTGSIIPDWQCNAAFMRNASSQATSGGFHNPMAAMTRTQDGFVPQSREQVAFKSRRKVQQLNDDMMALARQHQELAAAMIAFNDKREELAKLEK